MNSIAVLAALLVVFSSAASSSQRLSVWNNHRHRNISSEAYIRKVLQTRNAQRGIFDFKQLRALVEVRSRLYDEALRLSNVFPGQANTVPVAIRNKNRLSDSAFSWSCKDCPVSTELLLGDGSDDVSSETLSEFHDYTEQSQKDDFSPIESFNEEQTPLQKTEIARSFPINSDTLPINDHAPQQQVATSLMKDAYEYIWNHIVSTESLESLAEMEMNASGQAAFLPDAQPHVDPVLNSEEKAPTKPGRDEENLCLYSNSHWIDIDDSLVPLSETTDDYSADLTAHGETDIPATIRSGESTGDVVLDKSEQIVVPSQDEVESIVGVSMEEQLNAPIRTISEEAIFSPCELTAPLSRDTNINMGHFIRESHSEVIISPANMTSSPREEAGANISAESKSTSGVYRTDESMTIAFSSMRLQLLIGLVLSTFLLLFVLFVRLYQYVVLYPTNLVAWLEEESTKTFNASDFVALHALLSKYFPRVEWFFGLQDLETINLLHYLARSEMALGLNKSAKSNLERLIEALLPFGEDEYLASVYEDYGFVLHALGNHVAAVEALHKALRMISEEQVCRYEMDNGSISVGNVESENDWLDDHERHITSSSGNEDHNSSAIDEEDLLRSFEVEQREAVSLEKRLHFFGAGNPEDDTDALTATLSHSSSLIHSFGSPSTLDLNEALMVHADLNHAVRELESILEDPDYSAKKRATEMASWRVNDNEEGNGNLNGRGALFGDFLAVPTLEVARLCKKLGDVYQDAQDFAQAQVFFRNALSVVRKLSVTYNLENDISELETLIESLNHREVPSTKSPAPGIDHRFDPAVYNRFRVG